MDDIALITPDDVVRIIGLLGTVAGMVEPLGERRRVLIKGLADLIGADVWAWMLSRGFTDGHPGPLWVIDGGFANDEERTRLWHISGSQEFTRVIGSQVQLDGHTSVCFDVERLAPPDKVLMRGWLAETNIEHLIFVFYPLGDGVMSGIGLHRRPGRSAYTPRERAIVHAVTGQMDWLHRAGTEVAANTPDLARLSPRLSETLLYVLAGESRKQIAHRLGLSEHTIGDYFKHLYKHFHVNSRAELLAKFIG
ncbi:MAG: Transcriptional regulator, LuxR family protein [Phycisphaerales bacterium]|nr:Transcriptional regulator, LuxR family protein [Phycisphaerales bacterium]